MSKTLDRLKAKGVIADYDDERRLDHGYIVYLPTGQQWKGDTGCHTRGFDTVRDVLDELSFNVEPCRSCTDCNQLVLAAGNNSE